MPQETGPTTGEFEQAFPQLTQTQVDTLRRFGTCRTLADGAEVWRAGTSNMCMNVVIDGAIRVVDERTRAHIVTHEAGGFSGDIDVITGRPTVVSGYAEGPTHLLQIAGDCVRRVVAECPELSETILRAFLMRRVLLQASGSMGVLVVGSRFSADTLRIREFLTRSRIPITWEDLESSPDARRLLDEFSVCEEETPLVVLPSGQLLKSPTTSELAAALGILRPLEAAVVDVVVIGAGPAGLAAAVYGASEGLRTVVLDEMAPGGQAGTSSRIENYMGFPLGITGQQLADGAVAQAEKFGAQFITPAKILGITCGDAGLHDVHVEGMGSLTTRAVILATGAQYRALEVERLDQFAGRGVYYAATNVERILCGDSAVAVVGAGNSAGQAAVFMSETAAHVYLVVRGDDLRKSMSSYLAQRIEGLERAGRLSVLLNTVICELHDERRALCGITLRNLKDGDTRQAEVGAIFTMIGALPCTSWLNADSKVALDEKGFVLTGNDLVTRGLWNRSRSPYFLETACPGVFAVGDCRSGSIKRVASAVGEGSMAIALVHQYLAL